jgi:hypothetical protein
MSSSHWPEHTAGYQKTVLKSTLDVIFKFLGHLFKFIICLDEDEPENGEDEEGEATTSDQESEDEQGLMSPASQSGSRQASSTGAGKDKD